MSDTPDTILAFDYGQRRIGVAIGQGITGSASPLGIVRNSADGPDWAQIERLVRDWQPTGIVVGLPVNADDSPSALTPQVEAFAAALSRFGLPVHTEDERYSSRDAEARLKSGRQRGSRRRIARADIDSAAAALIAERWLSGK